jgi:hypothetical protein
LIRTELIPRIFGRFVCASVVADENAKTERKNQIPRTACLRQAGSG